MANDDLTIRELQKLAHSYALVKGFWCDEVGHGFDTKLLLVISEITEALEEIRDGHGPQEVYYKDGKPEGFGVELADAMIRIADLASWYGIDLTQLIRLKTEYNATRPFRHNKAF